MRTQFTYLIAMLSAMALFAGCSSSTSPEASSVATSLEVDSPAANTDSEPADKGEVEVASTDAMEPSSSKSSAEGYINGLWAANNTIPSSLMIGDTAPAVHVSDWVLGDELAGFPKDMVTVVEFWATWCPPCRTSMPHMSQLQDQYREDVTFIGVTREDLDTVNGFLAKPFANDSDETWKDKINYNIVTDDPEGSTNAGYMEAAQQQGIPSAFIVGRDGVVEWIGHPMSMDEPLAKVVSGEWDREEAKAELAREQELQQVQREMSMAMRSGDTDKALELLDEIAASNPDLPVDAIRVQILMSGDRGAEALQLIRAMKEQIWDNPSALNQFAWGLAAEYPEDARDAELAIELATRGVELTEENNPMVLDTLARAYYENGDLKQAIAWQEKAAELSSDGQITGALKRYQSELAEAEESEADEEEETTDESDGE